MTKKIPGQLIIRYSVEKKNCHIQKYNFCETKEG